MTPETIHSLADQLGIAWDNDKSFMDVCEGITSKRHLDEMDESELRMVADALRSGMFRVGAVVGTDTASILAISPEMLLHIIKKPEENLVGLLATKDYERLEKLIREHGGAWFNTGRDGMHDVTIPDVPHSAGATAPYGTSRFAAGLTNKTGIQWLAEAIFPSFLSGFIGRWLLTKLFDKLKAAKLIPKRFLRWLTKRVPVEVMERTAAPHALQDALPALDVVLEALASIDDEGDAQKRSALLSARAYFTSLAHAPTQEDMILASGVEAYLPGSYRERLAMQRTVRGPFGGRKYPRGISEEGKDVWREVLGEFEIQIKHIGGKDPVRQWTAAILTYQRVCKEKKIDPWQGGIKPLGGKVDGKKKRRKLLLDSSKMARKGFKKMTKLEDLLTDAFGLEWDDEFEYEDSIYVSSRDEFSMVFKSETVADRRTRAQMKEWLGKKGFVQGSRGMSYNGKQGFRIHARFTRDGVVFSLYFPFRSGEAMLLTKTRDRAKLLTVFRAYARKWWNGSHDNFR